jgi:hypothetical protein
MYLEHLHLEVLEIPAILEILDQHFVLPYLEYFYLEVLESLGHPAMQ